MLSRSTSVIGFDVPEAPVVVAALCNGERPWRSALADDGDAAESAVEAASAANPSSKLNDVLIGDMPSGVKPRLPPLDARVASVLGDSVGSSDIAPTGAVREGSLAFAAAMRTMCGFVGLGNTAGEPAIGAKDAEELSSVAIVVPTAAEGDTGRTGANDMTAEGGRQETLSGRETAGGSRGRDARNGPLD